MKTSSRMKNLTDEQVIELVNTNIELRKSLIENCGDWSYPGLEGSILIYSPSDFIRISKFSCSRTGNIKLLNLLIFVFFLSPSRRGS